jgi:hypothetical protein
MKSGSTGIALAMDIFLSTTEISENLDILTAW